MSILFNSLLAQFGVAPEKVVLLRHKDAKSMPGRSPYDLWRDDRPNFDRYQSCQSFANRPKLEGAPLWASFVVNYAGETMFAGMYAVEGREVLAEDTPQPHADGIDEAGSCDQYALQIDERFADIAGRLYIDWGDGARAWIQRAANQNKPIIELRPSFREPDFPGFMKFREPLSKIAALPSTWVAILKQATGVYLLTCPKTKEQYVGSASGLEGFWQRWMSYVKTGDGGNVGLKIREPSDYQVSILQAAGSGDSVDDVLAMEIDWKAKLQSREMGLNRN